MAACFFCGKETSLSFGGTPVCEECDNLREAGKKPPRHETGRTDDSIFQTLKQQLEAAKKRHDGAKENFWKVSGRPGERPGASADMPHPDGSLLVRKAVSEEIKARGEHLEALMRLNAYLIHGTVPDDLKKKRKLSGE